MRVVRCSEYGGLDILHDVTVGALDVGPGQVRLAVEVAEG